MKAVVYERYGSPDVLELRDIPIPEIGDNDVLVRIRAGGANPFDWHYMRGLPYIMRFVLGLRRPKSGSILGSDMAGVVEAVGKTATRFRPGDEVFCEVNKGGFAEYISVPEEKLCAQPSNLSFEESAAVPMAAMTALVGVRDVCKVEPGHKVLVNGASGGVGTFAVQIAKAFGAEVTGVCSHRNVDLVESLGADRVIDYTREDFTAAAERYDAIIDSIGNHPMSACRRVMTREGVYGAVGGGHGKVIGPLRHQLRAMLTSPFVSQKMGPINDKPNSDLPTLVKLIEDGKVKPVVDRTFLLTETAAAMRYLETGRARGKVVVSVD